MEYILAGNRIIDYQRTARLPLALYLRNGRIPATVKMNGCFVAILKPIGGPIRPSARPIGTISTMLATACMFSIRRMIPMTALFLTKKINGDLYFLIPFGGQSPNQCFMGARLP